MSDNNIITCPHCEGLIDLSPERPHPLTDRLLEILKEGSTAIATKDIIKAVGNVGYSDNAIRTELWRMSVRKQAVRVAHGYWSNVL
jgi:hypothetical protein